MFKPKSLSVHKVSFITRNVERHFQQKSKLEIFDQIVHQALLCSLAIQLKF